MKCLNCGEMEFEKAEWEGVFTLPYKDEVGLNVDVPRYNFACIGCGHIHKVLDMNARKRVLQETIDAHIKKEFAPRRDRQGVELVSVRKLAADSRIPYDMVVPLLEGLLEHHAGYSKGGGRITPTLTKEKGELIVVKKT